jgi:putative FmdB family regulatory protein
MPFYEYECKSCGHALEAMQKITDPPLKKCPDCGKSQLQRLMSAPVFRLKGGGWYETDFKGDQDNKRNLADRPEAEAPKDLPKDAAKDGAKDAPAAGAEGKVPDGKAEAAVSKDKPVEKSPEKSAPVPAKKPDPAKKASRTRLASHGKSAAKRPIKRPVHKAKRRI